MTTQQNFETIVKKVEQMKRSGIVDLSTEEDLSLAVMNLISLEEHFFFTGIKTKKDGYFDLLNEVRAVRKDLLERLIPKTQHEGETWCISKHLLATVMRLIEVGTKLHADGKKESAKETFNHAHKLWTLFWGLRLKLIGTPDLKAMAATDLSPGKAGKPWTLQDILDKLVDCCDE